MRRYTAKGKRGKLYCEATPDFLYGVVGLIICGLFGLLLRRSNRRG